MNQIKLICFDLDDTLWPCMPTIQYAENVYYQWLNIHKPKITALYTPDELRLKRKALQERTPDLGHDMSKLRIHSLYELADEFGYGHDWVDDAFEAFYQARQKIQFYDDVAPVLEKLKRHYQIAAATNGNADIYLTELAGLFDHAVSAIEAGVSKPDPAMFELLQQRSGLPAEAILHVGDHPVDDIEGARRAGIRHIWMDRQQQDWTHPADAPQHIARDMYQVLKLLGLD